MLFNWTYVDDVLHLIQDTSAITDSSIDILMILGQKLFNSFSNYLAACVTVPLLTLKLGIPNTISTPSTPISSRQKGSPDLKRFISASLDAEFMV